MPITILSLERGKVERYANEKKTTLEAAARDLRYSLLFSSTSGLIVTAHTADDQAETLLMHLISGCTLQALAGIRGVKGRVVRPLLNYRKEETEAICLERNLKWSEDSTNSTLFCMRNRVRHLYASKLSQDTVSTLCSIASNVSSFLSQIGNIETRRENHYITFSRNEFISSHPVKKQSLLLSLHNEVTDSILTSGQMDEIIKAIDNNCLYESRYYYLRVFKDEVRFYEKERYFVTTFEERKFPMNIKLIESSDSLALRVDTSLLKGKAIFRFAYPFDEIELKEHKVNISSLLSSYHIPYAIVLEDQGGICAVFSRLFGGKDRLAKRFLSSSCKGIGITLC